MSAQSTKKKRIGSRRWVANQNKTSEADEFHVTDSTSVMQHSTPGENTESLNIVANPDYSKSETQNPPSPELSKHRKKLGSSRRNKREQHGKDSATESYDKSREEVEEKTRGNETPRKTQMYVTIQPQQQEELSQRTEDDMSARHDSSVYLAITPDYFSEVQYSTGSNNPETDQESLISKSQNLQAKQDEHDADFKVVSDSCTLVETMLEGTHKSDTVQKEQLTENAHLVGISEVTSLNLPSGPTVDQQLIDQSSSTEIGGDEHYNVNSVTEKESKERHEGTYLLGQDGNLQGNDLESDSHVKSVVTEFSTTPEITIDQSSPRTNTELECIVEQAIFSSPNEHLNLHQVNSAQHSEDAVNKECEQEFKPTEMYEINHSSSVTHVTEDAEVNSGNLIDQAEISDTYQFEFIVKGTDDSAAKQEDLNTDDKQDVHPTKENSIEALEQTNEDYHVYDTDKLQISDTETVVSAFGHVYEGEGKVVEDDIKPSVEQTVQQEKEGILSGDEESESSLQTQQSETNAPLDSQPQQNDTDFNSIGSRRKLGSSRRNKGRHRVKESVAESYQRPTEEVVESVSDNEALETTQMLVAIEKTNQEESSQESCDGVVSAKDHNSLYSAIMSDCSSEVQNSNTTNYPETDMESLNPKSENLQEDHDERETDFKVEVSDKSVEATLEEMDQSDTLQSQEDRGTYHSEDGVDKVHEQEVNPTHELDHSSESVTQVATEDAEIISGNLTDQAEISDTYQFEFIVKGTDDSAAKQEDLNTDDKQDVHPTKENSIEASEQTNEDEDTEKLQISDIERVDSALGHVYEDESKVVEDDIKPSVEQTVHQEKEGILFGDEESESSLQKQQSETNAPLDSQPQQNDTDFNSIGSRRKLGSSRRNKGRHRVKESVAESYQRPTEEVVESVSDIDALETTQMLVAIEKTNQEESSPESEHDVVVPATDNTSLYSAIMPDYSSELQNSNTTNYPETDMESLIPKSENLQEDHDEEVKATHGLDHSSGSVTQVVTEDAEIISGNLIDQAEISDTYQFEFIVKGTDDSAAKQEDLNTDDKQDVHPTKENSIEASEQTNEDEDTEKLQISDIERVDSALGHVYEDESKVVEDDIKPSVEQTVHQEKEGILSGDEESESSLQTQQSETNAPLDSQPQQNDTDFNSIGSRRKLGSSRRNKGRHRVKESVAESYQRPTEEVVESVSDIEALETTQMLVAIEKTNQEESSPESEHDVVVPATDNTSLYSAIMPDYSSELQNSNTTNYPDTDMESLIPKSENLQEDHDEEVKATHELDHSSESVTQVATEDAEIISGNLIDQAEISDTYQFEFIVKSTDDSAAKQEDLNTDDNQDVHPTKENSIEASEQTNEDYHVYDTDKLQISDTETVVSAFGHVYEVEGKVVEDDIKPSVEQTVQQEKEGILSGDEESESSLQTQQSETNAPLDSQPQQNDTDFNSIGSRRKLGSSRRNKGRHRVKESVAESYQRPTEEVVESVSDNEALETTQMLVAIEKTNQEESSQESCDGVVSAKDHNSLYSAIMSDCSSEVQNSNTTNYPETDMESLNPKSENLQEDHDERETDFKVEVSDKSVEATLEEMDQSDTLQSQEDRGTYHSEDGVDKVHEQEVNPTHELDHSSESVTQVATEDAEIISGNLTDQAEISDTYQFEFIVKSTDDSAAKQEDLNTDDKQDVHPTKENSIEASEQTNEDEDTEKLQISDIERVDSALGHVYEDESKVVEDDIKPSVEQTVHQEKEGILFGDEESESSLQTQQSETNAPLDSQPQQNDTDFNSIGSRRKLGSSRRNKGRHRVKESVAESYQRPTEEVVESVSDIEALETTQMLVAIEKTNQEESSPESEHDVVVPATDNTSLYSAIMPDYSSELQNSNTTNYPDTDMEILIVKSTDDSAAKQDDLNTDDKQDVHPTKENSIEASEQTNEDEDTEKLQISDTETVDSALGHVYEGEASVVEDDIKPSVEQTVHQEKEGLNSEVEESDSSSQTLQSGTNAYLDSQPEQNDTNLNPVGSRRKLGSSRRNRGRRHAKDPVAESNDSPAEEIVGNIRDNAQTERISDQVKENEHVGALVGISEFMSSSVHPNLTVDQQVIDLSNSTEMPEQDLSNVYSVKEKESKDGDEDTDLLRQDGNSQGNYLVSESHLKLSNIESSTTPEISTEKNSTGEHADIECVKQAAVSSPEEEFSTNEEQKHVNFSQVRGSLHSENVLNEVHEEVVKPTQMQEMHQIDFSSINESLQSEMNALLNSQDNSQDNSVRMEEETDFNPTGNRRKLGSSRRNKGRQQVKVSVGKTYHEPKDEFVENARGDEALETTKMLLATDTTGQEEFKQQTNLDLKPVNNKENTEKMPEDTILSQNVMDSSTTTDITSSSGKDDSVEPKDVKEHENFSQFTGNNTVKIDLMQSPEDDSYIQNISNHDDSVTTRPVTMDVLEQEEAYLVQNREALSCDKDSWQQIDDAVETMGYVIKDYNTEVASSVDVQVFRQDEVGENFEDPTKKDHEAQEMNISQGITHAELFSPAQTNIGTLAPFDIGLKENRAETAVDVSKESGISCNQQQGIQEKTDLDNSENLQGKSKQKRRKMGSTRRTQLNREPEEGMGNEDENKESDSNMVDMKFDRMEVVELPVIVTADVHQDGNTKLSPVDKEQQGTNVISTVQDLALTVLPPVDPTKENNFEALEQTNEEQQISGIERVDTALGQVYVIEGQVEDDIKPSAEQTVLQEKEGIFSEVEESNSSLQTLQSGTNATLDSQPEQNDTNFKPIGSRRKLGSSRRNKGRQHAKDSEQQGTNEISTVQDLALMALPPEQSTVDVEPSQLDDFTSTEMHVPSVLARTNTTNTGITGSFISSYETTQSAQNDEERPESVNLRQDQALKSAEAPVVADLEMMKSIVRGGAEDEHKDDQANIQELNDVNEGAHNTNLEMKNSSPNLNSPTRRRKMGSTRRNLGSRSKREDLHQQQEVENEATETVTNVGDVKSARFQSIEEKEELQPLTEDKEIDSEQRKEKVFETVEYSHAFESHVKPPPHQEIEENPVSHVQLVETDYQLTPRDLPAIPSTSPTAGGRRRKLGSSRRSRGHQTEREDRITDTQNRSDVRSITEESDIKTTEEDSLGLDKISEVDESDKKPPSNISASKAEEHLRPVSEKTPQQVTPVHSTYAEILLSQESQKTFSLAGSPKGAALKSNSYNVMMVGDSSVGKSSFMKRAQSGKFSLDLPASVGLDSCTWTVVVDGKPVVLQLWDTAGQERFHSITRQIFHKAQAFLLMYDITSTQSFSAVSYWANCIQEGAAENVTILLLGNKNDMAERKVKTEEGANLARECNFEFMECSAATGENVIHSLESVARMLSQKVDTREETTVLQKEPRQKKSGCC